MKMQTCLPELLLDTAEGASWAVIMARLRCRKVVLRRRLLLLLRGLQRLLRGKKMRVLLEDAMLSLLGSLGATEGMMLRSVAVAERFGRVLGLLGWTHRFTLAIDLLVA